MCKIWHALKKQNNNNIGLFADKVTKFLDSNTKKSAKKYKNYIKSMSPRTRVEKIEFNKSLEYFSENYRHFLLNYFFEILCL